VFNWPRWWSRFYKCQNCFENHSSRYALSSGHKICNVSIFLLTRIVLRPASSASANMRLHRSADSIDWRSWWSMALFTLVRFAVAVDCCRRCSLADDGANMPNNFLLPNTIFGMSLKTFIRCFSSLKKSLQNS
jgi:hypothetical protein